MPGDKHEYKDKVTGDSVDEVLYRNVNKYNGLALLFMVPVGVVPATPWMHFPVPTGENLEKAYKSPTIRIVDRMGWIGRGPLLVVGIRRQLRSWVRRVENPGGFGGRFVSLGLGV